MSSLIPYSLSRYCPAMLWGDLPAFLSSKHLISVNPMPSSFSSKTESKSGVFANPFFVQNAGVALPISWIAAKNIARFLAIFALFFCCLFASSNEICDEVVIPAEIKFLCPSLSQRFQRNSITFAVSSRCCFNGSQKNCPFVSLFFSPNAH